MKRLGRKFFAQKPEVVAKELLGKLLVRKSGNNIWIGKIVETEAYLGIGDTASHSHKGMTKRNEVMFGKAGIAYVYFTYGMHWLLNFITEKEGKPSGVLIRAVEPLYDPIFNFKILNLKLSELKKFGTGPARLTKWMKITGDLNREDITKSDNLFVVDRYEVGSLQFLKQELSKNNIVERPRIGVDYAKEHKDLLLRFYVKNSKFITKV